MYAFMETICIISFFVLWNSVWSFIFDSFKMTVQDLRFKLERAKGKKEDVLANITRLEGRIVDNTKDIRKYEKVREIIRQVGLKTQQQLIYNISEITSMALSSVLEQPYELELEFVERRNKTECDVWFVRNGQKIDPFSGGGGAIDIAAFALRVACWSMSVPKFRNTLILDEPFKHLKGEEANRKMLQMVSEISSKLGIQIIMVGDERVSREAVVEITDKLFETSIKNGVTKVEEQ